MMGKSSRELGAMPIESLQLHSQKISDKQVKLLRDAGLDTVGKLQALVLAQGEWWHRPVKGIGRDSKVPIEDALNAIVGDGEPEEPAAQPAKKPKRARQGILPGTIPEPSKSLIEKAEEMESVRDERQRLAGQEGDLQKELIQMMHAEKVDKIELSSGRVASLCKEDPKEKVKLSTPKKGDD